jgi:hypothetical protein
MDICVRFQDELIQIMAHSILRALVKEINESPFFSIIADGTTDISGKEQMSVVIRFVRNEDLVPCEVFMGLFEPPDSTAATLFTCLKDVIVRLGLDIRKLRGLSFDGGSNMAGRLTGVQARFTEEFPLSIFVHCANHSLDLCLVEVARQVCVDIYTTRIDQICIN